MRLKCFLALILSCSDRAGATFKGMVCAINECDLEKFEKEMVNTPANYAEYVEYVENLEPDAEYKSIHRREVTLVDCHFTVFVAPLTIS